MSNSKKPKSNKPLTQEEEIIPLDDLEVGGGKKKQEVFGGGTSYAPISKRAKLDEVSFGISIPGGTKKK